MMLFCSDVGVFSVWCSFSPAVNELECFWAACILRLGVCAAAMLGCRVCVLDLSTSCHSGPAGVHTPPGAVVLLQVWILSCWFICNEAGSEIVCAHLEPSIEM